MVAHGLDLSGWLSENPLFFVSGLRGASTMPGLLDGQPGWLDGNAGVKTQALGFLVADDWLRGIVPWWNPYSGVGMPLAGQMQPAGFFLPFVLLLHLPHGVTLLKISLQAVAGLGTLALLREIGLGGRAAVVGAILAEFDGTFAWFADPPVMPIAFLPWMLFGLEACARRECARTGVCAFAIGLAFSVVAGAPEVAYLDGLLALLWACVLLAAPGRRGRLLLRVGFAGMVGLLLSAPASVSFFTSLPASFAGDRPGGTAARHAFGANGPMLFFPYAHGALLAVLGPRADRDPWWEVCGYAGTVLPLLAAAALLARGDRAVLRWCLGGWIAVCLGRAFGWPVVTTLVNLVPGVSLTQFDRYAAPSCEMAAIVLAGCCLDDGRHRRAWPAVLAVAAAILVAFVAGWSDVVSMLHGSQRGLVIASLVWGVAAFACAGVLLGRPALRAGLALLACLDAGVLFGVPLLAGARQPSLDAAPVVFLQRTLGLGRFASVGGIWPNYGAMFRLAGINSNVLPDPQDWVDHVRRALLPSTDGQNFFPPASAGPDFAGRTLAYERDGVSAVLVPAGSEPFHEASVERVAGPLLPWVLVPGASAMVTVPASIVRRGEVDAVGVPVGTYAGEADGALRATLCEGERCTAGTATLAGARDDGRLVVRFDRPVGVGDAALPVLTLTHDGGRHAVAIWTHGAAGLAELTLFYRPVAADQPVFVARAGGLDIYRLPHPAPYFSTGDTGCVLAATSRAAVSATCPEPTVLTRLELFFPGWRATVDGRSAPVVRAADPLFEAVGLPAGRHVVRFAYAPPGARIGWGCLVVGVLLLAGFVGRPGALPLDPAGGKRPQTRSR